MPMRFGAGSASPTAAVKVSFKGQEVSGLSIMGLMMLAAGIGSEIELSCTGRQAAEALEALSTLVEGKFGED
jgi:phosphocarrier protein HPr